MNNRKTSLSSRCAWLLLVFASGLPLLAQTTSSDKQIRDLISTYAATVDSADTAMAEQIFSDAPDVTFIHPHGEEHGRRQIVTDVFHNLMGETFTARKLTPKDIAVHVYGDTAWSEFNWDFVATLRRNGSAVHSQGVETQIYRLENGQWRIVHVHYSAMPPP